MADRFIPVPNPDSNIGRFAAEMLQDGVDMISRVTFAIPSGWSSVAQAVVVLVPGAGGSPPISIRWAAWTNFGQICANEAYTAHSDNIGVIDSPVTQNEIECLNIMGALTGIAAGDVVGLEFLRYGSDINDTVDDHVYLLGVWISDT